MTNSRDKFEAWSKNTKTYQGHNTASHSVLGEERWKAWLAGRESMRDEAAQVCDDLWQKDALAFNCREAIKEIQP